MRGAGSSPCRQFTPSAITRGFDWRGGAVGWSLLRAAQEIYRGLTLSSSPHDFDYCISGMPPPTATQASCWR